jgi:hypothetical protein
MTTPEVWNEQIIGYIVASHLSLTHRVGAMHERSIRLTLDLGEIQGCLTVRASGSSGRSKEALVGVVAWAGQLDLRAAMPLAR